MLTENQCRVLIAIRPTDDGYGPSTLGIPITNRESVLDMTVREITEVLSELYERGYLRTESSVKEREECLDNPGIILDDKAADEGKKRNNKAPFLKLVLFPAIFFVVGLIVSFLLKLG